jgi:hypothetical protein
MMTTRIRLGIAVIAVLATGNVAAQTKACSPADAAKAEKAVDRIVNWDQLYKTFQEYGHCDTGAVDENFTEALLRCIVEWKNVEGLAKPMEKDRPYRDFVHKHLGSPEAKGDLNNIYSRAKMNCPKGLETFCSDITMAVKPFAGMEMIPTTSDPAAPAAPATPAAPPKK